MKKVVYLAPIFLLSFLGKNALAGQVEHVSNLDSALEQASAINNSTADTNKNTTVLQSQVLRINKTNQTAIPDSIKQSTGFQDEKIAANTNVTINNPANNRIHVNWVDANGQNISNTNNGYDIDLTKVKAQDSYRWIPKGYQLHNPDGKYNVNGGKLGADTLKGNVEHHAAVTHKVTQWAEYDDDGQYKVIYGMSDYAKKHAEQEYEDNVLAETGDGAPKWQKQIKTITDKPAYDVQQLPVAFVDSNNNIVGMIQNYTGNAGTSQNINLSLPTGYKLADGATLPTSVTFVKSDAPLLIKVTSNGQTNSVQNPANNTINVKFVDRESGWQVGSSVIDLAKVQNGTNYYNVPKGYSADSSAYYVDARINAQKAAYLFYMDTGNSESEGLNLSHSDIQKLIEKLGYNLDGHSRLETTVGNTSCTVKGAYGPVTFGYNSAVFNAIKTAISDLEQSSGHEWNGGSGLLWLDYSAKSTFTDNLHTIRGNTVTVPVHRTNRFTFSDNSGNVKSYSGNTVNVILEHQTKRIDPNNSSLNLDANNQLHLINTSQAQPKQSTTNFKVGYLLDLVTNNKIIDTNNAQALNNTKIFTVNPSLPIGYDSLNTKLLTLNL